MRNKKGFTLVELIAVVAILGLLIGLTTVVVVNIKNSVLEKDYENIKSYIETKAVEYANKTGIKTINVQTMIDEGLINPDKDNILLDPRDTNKFLNCYVIEVEETSDGSFEAKSFKEVLAGDNANQCGSYEQKSTYVMEYYEGGLWKTLTNDESLWIKTDDDNKIKLRVSGDNLEKYYISWSATPKDVTGSDANIELAVEEKEIYTNSVTVKLTKKEDASETTNYSPNVEVTRTVRCDKQKPEIKSVEAASGSWGNNSQKIKLTITFSDGVGSGVNKYAIIPIGSSCSDVSNDDKQAVIKNKATRDDLTKGKYKVCAWDKVENMSDESSSTATFEVNKVDTKAPTITVEKDTLSIVLQADYDVMSNVLAIVDEAAEGEMASGIKEKRAYYINSRNEKVALTTTKNLPAGEYQLFYEAIDNALNKSEKEIKLIIFVPEKTYDTTGEFDYEVLATGTYEIAAYGAQGKNYSSYAGGKGGYVYTKVKLTAGDILRINVGGQNGYNGGGSQTSTQNGGGATTVKLKNATYNYQYILRAAGGGGAGTASKGGDGGSGNAAGGASVGSGAGTAGTNSGGGTSSPTYTYQTCSTCGGGCASYRTESYNCSTCGGGCAAYYDHYCDSWGSGVGVPGCGCTTATAGSSSCGCRQSDCCCYHYSGGECARYESTYSCNCSTRRVCSSYYATYSCNCYDTTLDGKPGNGGSNYVLNNAALVISSATSSQSGKRTGDGTITIKYMVD